MLYYFIDVLVFIVNLCLLGGGLKSYVVFVGFVEFLGILFGVGSV